MIDARTATPAETLEQRIMDPCAAKSEAEWWAHREIAKQRAENERLLQALGLVTTAVQDMEIDVENPLGMAQRVVAEVDRQRAEIERLRAERDALRDAAREYLTTLGGAMKAGKFQMGGTAEMAHFVRQAMQKLDSLVFDREGPRPAGLEKLHEPLKRQS